jgi:hypothetical protein
MVTPAENTRQTLKTPIYKARHQKQRQIHISFRRSTAPEPAPQPFYYIQFAGMIFVILRKH